jgi:hypothetical protein
MEGDFTLGDDSDSVFTPYFGEEIYATREHAESAALDSARLCGGYGLARFASHTRDRSSSSLQNFAHAPHVFSARSRLPSLAGSG